MPFSTGLLGGCGSGLDIRDQGIGSALRLAEFSRRGADRLVEPLLSAVAEDVPLLVSGAPDAFRARWRAGLRRLDDGAEPGLALVLRGKAPTMGFSCGIVGLPKCRQNPL